LSTAVPNGTIYGIDTTTGAATPIVTLTNDVITALVDITILNGTLYASDVDTATTTNFGSIAYPSGAFSPINQQNGSSNWQALAANPALGIMYASADDGFPTQILSVTPSGVITLIGTTPVQVNDFAYDSGHGILYAIDDSDKLYTINTSTGAATLIGDTGLGTFKIGLGYDSNNNVLYGNDVHDHNLYTLSTTTGAVTLVGPNGTTAEIDGLADFGVVSSVPEPATMAWIGLAVGGLACTRRFRR